MNVTPRWKSIASASSEFIIKENSEEEFVFALKSKGDKYVLKVMVMVNGVPDV